jgi:hypothetical protein
MYEKSLVKENGPFKSSPCNDGLNFLWKRDSDIGPPDRSKSLAASAADHLREQAFIGTEI